VHLATLAVDKVSGGDISRDGGLVLLRREDRGWLWNRAAGESLQQALARDPQEVPVRGKKQGPNGEAATFDPTGGGYYTISEGKKEWIYKFDLPSAEESGR
jgi:hypothetical protein